MEFLGRGLTFPVCINEKTGVFSLSEYEKDVKEAIIIILSTSKGERVMRPDFGCGIHKMAFSVINANNLAVIESDVRNSLTRYEPRIEILGVDVKADTEESGKLNVNIDYKIRTTNNRFNLVYPFYLNE